MIWNYQSAPDCFGDPGPFGSTGPFGDLGPFGSPEGSLVDQGPSAQGPLKPRAPGPFDRAMDHLVDLGGLSEYNINLPT